MKLAGREDWKVGEEEGEKGEGGGEGEEGRKRGREGCGRTATQSCTMVNQQQLLVQKLKSNVSIIQLILQWHVNKASSSMYMLGKQ